jgi:hypothetical protein
MHNKDIIEILHLVLIIYLSFTACEETPNPNKE